MDTTRGKYYFIGSGTGWTIIDMVTLVRDEVAKKTGRKVDVVSVKPPENLSQIEFRSFVADTTKFNTATGWKANTTLAEGINRTIDYFQRTG